MIATILDSLTNGDSIQMILAEYPAINKSDIQATLQYVADLVNERIVQFA